MKKERFDASQITKFMTVKEAAVAGRLHPVTIQVMLKDKRLTRYKLGRRTLIKREEFMALIQPKEIVAQD